MSTFGFRGASSLPRGCNIICLISTVLSASLNMMSCSIHVTSEDLSKSFPQLESKSGSYNTPSKTTLHCPIWNGSTWSKFLKDLFCCGSVHPPLLFLLFFWWHYLSSIIPVLLAGYPTGPNPGHSTTSPKTVSLALQFFSFHVLQPSSNDKRNSPYLI